nr:hypothetical protein [Oscillospiraceae bacterium]
LPVLPVSIERLPTDDQPVQPAEPEGRVALISRRVNYAWGYDDYGLFVDTAGYVYPFDFREQYGGLVGKSELPGKLDLLRQWSAPVAHIDPADVQAFVESAQKIRNRDSYQSESRMCDYGERQLIFCDPETGEQLMLAEWGDWDKSLTDPNAPAAILKGKAIMEAVSSVNGAGPELRLYTPEDVPFLELPNTTHVSGRYYLSFSSQLQLLSDETGIPLAQLTEGMNDHLLDSYAFFVDLEASGTPTAILCRDGEITILMEGETEPHCIVAAFPKGSSTIRGECHDMEGRTWTPYEKGDPNHDPEVYKGLSYGVSNDRMQDVWEECGLNGLKGICVQTSEEYEHFLASCQAHDLMEDGSDVRSLIEAEAAPGFSEYVLLVRITRRDEGMHFGWEPLTISDRYLSMGLVSDPPRNQDWSGPFTDGVIAWIWLPRHYLMPDMGYNIW